MGEIFRDDKGNLLEDQLPQRDVLQRPSGRLLNIVGALCEAGYDVTLRPAIDRADARELDVRRDVFRGGRALTAYVTLTWDQVDDSESSEINVVHAIQARLEDSIAGSGGPLRVTSRRT